MDELSDAPRPAATFLLWLAAGVLMFATLGIDAVDRTQEARVLVTAESMVEQPVHEWLIPHMNGKVRLKKPPLAYWLTAGSFHLLGVSDVAGRVPGMLAAWLTLGVVYQFGRSLFNSRAGLIAAGALLGCLGFFRFGRLAETDIYVTLFVTTAIFAMWRAHAAVVAHRTAGAVGWFHLAGFAMALATMTKGPPAAYPLLFLVALVCSTRQWRVLFVGLLSGAVITFLLLALPWFLYIHHNPEGMQAIEDLQNSVAGEGHNAGFWVYVPYLLSQSMPWTLLLGLAIVFVARRWGTEPHLRVPAIWAACVLLPLCAWGNKQGHYLLPMWPALMLILGGFADRAAAGQLGVAETAWFKRLWIITCAAMMVAALAVVPVGLRLHDELTFLDGATALALVLIVDALWRHYRRHGVNAVVWPFTVAAVLVIMLTVGVWSPSLNQRNTRVVADEIRHDFGAAPCAFLGSDIKRLSLCFYLGGEVPELETPEERQAEANRHPALVLIEEFPLKSAPKSLPPGYKRYETDRKVYLARPATPVDDAFADRP